jgi:hypothetical protein
LIIINLLEDARFVLHFRDGIVMIAAEISVRIILSIIRTTIFVEKTKKECVVESGNLAIGSPCDSLYNMSSDSDIRDVPGLKLLYR